MARAGVKSLNKLAEAPSSCQACTRFPELEEYIDGDLPTSFDWRDYGAVTPVKNQVRFVACCCCCCCCYCCCLWSCRGGGRLIDTLAYVLATRLEGGWGT